MKDRTMLDQLNDLAEEIRNVIKNALEQGVVENLDLIEDMVFVARSKLDKIAPYFGEINGEIPVNGESPRSVLVTARATLASGLVEAVEGDWEAEYRAVELVRLLMQALVAIRLVEKQS